MVLLVLAILAVCGLIYAFKHHKLDGVVQSVAAKVATLEQQPKPAAPAPAYTSTTETVTTTTAPGPIAVQPAPAPVAVGVAPVDRAVKLGDAPPHDPEYVYEDEVGYPESAKIKNGGNGYPIIRTAAGLPRGDAGNPNYVDGQANITPATEMQKQLARRINQHISQMDYADADAALMSTVDGDRNKANDIINAYSTSAS